MVAVLLPLVLACRVPVPADTAAEPADTAEDTADTPPPTGFCRGVAEDGSGQEAFRVSSPTFPTGVAMGVVFGQEGGLLPDGYPVVVVARGGWGTDAVPVEGPEIGPGAGVLQLYVNLPGGTGPFATEGADDLRGPLARAALATALAYGAGQLRDMDGCLLSERVPVPVSSLAPLLHGQSNGGNLVLGTLSDATLELPPLSGISTFESPISSQIVTVELGQTRAPNPRYVPGQCAWTPADGLGCPLDYGPLGWDPNIPQADEVLGAVYLDMDGDGAWTPVVDYPIYGARLTDGTLDRVAFSPPLALELQRQGVWEDRFLTPSQAEDFWKERDGSLLLARAALAFPDVPMLVLGTAQDHMCAASDHPHVSGLASAWREAGGTWVRVNPDAAYMDAVVGPLAAWADNPANLDLVPGDPAVLLEPDEVEVGVRNDLYTAAAVMELAERAWSQDLSVDLEETLGRRHPGRR